MDQVGEKDPHSRPLLYIKGLDFGETFISRECNTWILDRNGSHQPFSFATVPNAPTCGLAGLLDDFSLLANGFEDRVLIDQPPTLVLQSTPRFLKLPQTDWRKAEV